MLDNNGYSENLSQVYVVSIAYITLLTSEDVKPEPWKQTKLLKYGNNLTKLIQFRWQQTLSLDFSVIMYGHLV